MRRLAPFLLLAGLVLGTGLGIGLGLSEAPSATPVQLCLSYNQPGGRTGTVCEPDGVSYTLVAPRGTACPRDVSYLWRKAHLELRVWTAVACYTRTAG